MASVLRKERFKDVEFPLLEMCSDEEQVLRYGGLPRLTGPFRLTVITSMGSTRVVNLASDPVSFRTYGPKMYSPRPPEMEQDTESETPLLNAGSVSPVLSILAESVADEIDGHIGVEDPGRDEGREEDMDVSPDDNDQQEFKLAYGCGVTAPLRRSGGASLMLSDISSCNVNVQDVTPEPVVAPRSATSLMNQGHVNLPGNIAQYQIVICRAVPDSNGRHSEEAFQSRNPEGIVVASDLTNTIGPVTRERLAQFLELNT